MKSITVKSLFIVTAVSAAVMAQAHVEPGSFLNKRAHTVHELIFETEHDAQVRNRYERHFHMSEAELIEYFGHLHVGKLSSTGDYVVYNCHDDEIIRARVFHLKAGTPMFVDAYNKPILKISCGNPMTAPTPKVAIVVRPHAKPVPHETPTPLPAPVQPPVIVTPPAPAPAPCPPPVAPSVSTVTTSSVSNKSFSSLFFLPIVAVFSYHSNHCSTTTIIKKTPTPEPASLLIMGFGATAMMLRRKKRA